MTINKPMHNIEILSPARDHIIIKGDLTFSTINKAHTTALKLEQSAPSINIDLQQLGKIDSAGLALLIEWIKFAQASQTELRFTHIPAQLSALTKLCDISEIDLFNL
ncbi:STAS domain-containing protein [Methyloprofundus sp.]|uniref:STAS domain-containing protein n=1 Tax=Methyloprofundus sp. TaxID=2020875 RepID=UPI002604836F|nr:STAS domain-containing protein [Methyloprofundus sp.]